MNIYPAPQLNTLTPTTSQPVGQSHTPSVPPVSEGWRFHCCPEPRSPRGAEMRSHVRGRLLPPLTHHRNNTLGQFVADEPLLCSLPQKQIAAFLASSSTPSTVPGSRGAITPESAFLQNNRASQRWPLFWTNHDSFTRRPKTAQSLVKETTVLINWPIIVFLLLLIINRVRSTPETMKRALILIPRMRFERLFVLQQVANVDPFF